MRDRVGVGADMDRVSVKGDETLEMTCVGASGVCERVVKDCSVSFSVRKAWYEERAHLVKCGNNTSFIGVGNYSRSPPHACSWRIAMNVVPPFVEVETF